MTGRGRHFRSREEESRDAASRAAAQGAAPGAGDTAVSREKPDCSVTMGCGWRRRRRRRLLQRAHDPAKETAADGLHTGAARYTEGSVTRLMLLGCWEASANWAAPQHW